MITNAIILFFAGINNFITSFLPELSFINGLINAKNTFIEWVTPILKHSLWFFNVPVLSIAISILITYFIFVFVEYGLKTALKYVLRV